MLGRKKDEMALSDGIWQDREIQFDVDQRQLKLIPGEYLVERIENVEDTKGNNGDRGILRITNIRLIWHAVNSPRINLSIGYNNIHGVTTRILKSKVRGHAESLYLMARNANTRFEFVFTCANPTHTKLFTTVIGIHRAFETTKLYRELKMRGALVDEQENLRVLPLEQQIERLDGVWNLSSEQVSHFCCNQRPYEAKSRLQINHMRPRSHQIRCDDSCGQPLCCSRHFPIRIAIFLP
uniref:Bardet-Biedl syndrome 5-like protein n=1 Tax=Bursaphelenchus xylophilus TaxID=6326 RepID=A0A1I7SGP5_BURXY